MKKIISMVLCLAMAVSLFAVPALAAADSDNISLFADGTFSTTNSGKAIITLTNLGIMDSYNDFYGNSTQLFKPKSAMTRGDIIRLVFRAYTGSTFAAVNDIESEEKLIALSDSFSDVKACEDKELKLAVGFFLDKGIIQKYENTALNMDNGATFGEFAALITKTFGFDNTNTSETNPDMWVGAESAGKYFEIGMAASYLLSYDGPDGISYTYDVPSDYSTKITRELAAQIVYNVLFDIDTPALDATNESNIYGVRKFNFKNAVTVIRATKNLNMGLDVKNTVVLDNGADVITCGNFDNYIGYQALIKYCDFDNSGTYSPDEPIAYIQPSVSVGVKFKLDHEPENMMKYGKDGQFYDLSYGTYYTVGGYDTARLYLTNGTHKYLNYNPWPDCDAYNFDKVLNTVSREDDAEFATYETRPGMTFNLVDYDGDMCIDYLFAFETRMGKVVSNANGIVMIYDYYMDRINTYDAAKLNITGSVNIGDVVTIDEYGDKAAYLKPAKSYTGEFLNGAGSIMIGGQEASKSSFFRDEGKAVENKAEAIAYYDISGVVALKSAADKGDYPYAVKAVEEGSATILNLKTGITEKVALTALPATGNTVGSFGMVRFNGKEYIYGNAKTIFGTVVEAKTDAIKIITTDNIDDATAYQSISEFYKSSYCDVSVNNNVTNTASNPIVTIYLDDTNSVIGIN